MYLTRRKVVLPKLIDPKVVKLSIKVYIYVCLLAKKTWFKYNSRYI